MHRNTETQTALDDPKTKFVNIPSTVKNEETDTEYTVTLISAYAFWLTSIETIIIPYSVEEIHQITYS